MKVFVCDFVGVCSGVLGLLLVVVVQLVFARVHTFYICCSLTKRPLIGLIRYTVLFPSPKRSYPPLNPSPLENKTLQKE